MVHHFLECTVEFLMLLIVLAINLLLCALVGKWAASKGRSAAFWFCASVLITPVLAAVLVGFGTKIGHAALRKCPDCREMVKHDATKCKHCGTTLTPVAPA